MQSKFGLKDFVLIVLVAIVGISVWLGMVQEDRKWRDVRRLDNKVSTIETQLSAIERRLEDGIAISGPVQTSSGNTSQQANSGTPEWAVPNIPIAQQPRWSFADDPRDEPDYRRGGEFFEVFEAQPKKLTPILGEDTYSRRIQDQVLDYLATFDPETLELRGQLADAWQYDPEGMWLRIHLNPSARFSDGVPVTAHDVEFTFHDFLMNPQLETESLRSITRNVESMRALDDHTVEVKFTEPEAYNLVSALVFYVLPKHFYEQFTPSQINQATGLLMGSGPYKLQDLDPDDQWTPGENVVLVRNESYWGPKPALDRLVYNTINEELARLVAYQNGEADMILPSSPQFVELTEQEGFEDDTYALKWVNMRSGYAFIAWQCGPRNGTLTPFHDKRVRLAMTLMLDRERMIREIWRGVGEIAVGPYNPPSPAADPDIKPWGYDPERARQLLAEAGWVDRDNDGILENERGDEFEFEFTRSSGGTIHERIEKFVVDSCAALGIRCVPKVVDWALYDQILKNRDFDALIMAWSASSPESDPKQIWHPDSIKNQGHNFIQWDAGQGPLIDEIRSTLDFDKRMELFHQFHQLVHDEQPYTFVRVSPWLRFISKDFKNVHPYNKGLEQREFYQPAPSPGI